LLFFEWRYKVVVDPDFLREDAERVVLVIAAGCSQTEQRLITQSICFDEMREKSRRQEDTKFERK
jgi:hypothetical protein